MDDDLADKLNVLDNLLDDLNSIRVSSNTKSASRPVSRSHSPIYATIPRHKTLPASRTNVKDTASIASAAGASAYQTNAYPSFQRSSQGMYFNYLLLLFPNILVDGFIFHF